ncbi:MAG: energy-coupling factor transporter transmembrane protein EcfT [Desulfobacterales bacterium]|nr:energy-coupling factor transporter transmembrane protein EcfT [Desulfobacterales bacterium]
MADLTAFSYHPGRSFLHLLDVRFKIIFLILISLTGMQADPPALCLLTFLFLCLIKSSRLSLISILKELRYFLVLLFFVLIARALSTPGTPVFEFKLLSISRQGLYDGILICWRLALVVLLGLIFVSTTRPSEIRTAVAWFLKPFPFIPGKKVATMIGLIMRFVPVILAQAKETSDAQRARGIENRKNPIYRLVKLAVPLIFKTFQNANNLAVAMEARCYSENRTDPDLSSKKNDWIAFFFVICLCILVVEI